MIAKKYYATNETPTTVVKTFRRKAPVKKNPSQVQVNKSNEKADQQKKGDEEF